MWRRRTAFACFGLFALIALFMVTGVTNMLDDGILQTIDTWRNSTATTLMLDAEDLGDGKVEIPLILLVAAILWFARRPTSARRYLALCVSAEALYLLAKLAFHRPRPTVIPQLGEAGWFSFPSGHSMLAPVTWGLGLVLLAQLVQARQTRMAIGIAAAMICLIIASCRIYLGVHYSTDVLAGLALGTGWVLLWWEWVVPLFPSDARDLHQPG